VMKLIVAIVALFVCGCCANWPTKWNPETKTPKDTIIEFTLALQQQNIEEFDALFERLTTPGSPEFRQWRTIQELTDMIAPPKEDQDYVLNYLRNHGCTGTSYGDVIVAEGPAHAVEEIFSTEFFEFRHVAHSLTVHRGIHYPTIPEELSPIVIFVTGISTFPYERPQLHRKPIQAAMADSDKWIVPQTLRAMYNLPSTPSTAKANSQAVVEFGLVAGISTDDLQKFNQLTNGPSNASLAYTVGTFAFTPISPIDGESTLDVQYIMAVAPGVATSFWTVNGWVYDFTTLVQTRQSRSLPVPLVFSLSYAWAEADQCEVTGNGATCGQVGGSDTSYVTTTSRNFQKLGASGISILVASGDAGAAAKVNIDCDSKNSPVNPNFPASSPYVTTVGGTMLQNGGTALTGSLPPFCSEPSITCAGGGVEIVCSVPDALITSGGGFSNILAQPSYQSSDVSAWMNSGALQPPTKYWSSSGRAYPDVAALAHKYLIVENGESFSVDGTSASTPVTSGIIAMINGNRLNKGLTSLGFINPSLYDMSASSFTDVTIGNNTGTEYNDGRSCNTYGYGASAGWDPCTGLGTPNFNSWNSYFTSN